MKKEQYKDACMVKAIIIVMISMLPSRKDRDILISGLQKTLAEPTQHINLYNSNTVGILNVSIEDYLIVWLDGFKDSTSIERSEILVN